MARIAFCESCGAPLDAPWAEIAVVCRYCGAHTLPGPEGEPVPSSVPADGRPRLNIDGRTYVIEGRIAAGDSCEVYRARWVRRLGELVVIKVLRARRDADLLRREAAVLEGLVHSRVEGADHFATRLPEPIALAPVRTRRHGERLAAVYRWKAGFVHPLPEIFEAWPRGVPGPVAVWLLKRLLELLAWIHRAGVVHGAVIPPHVLVHPRDHGAILVGWGSASTRSGDGWAPLAALSRSWARYYPARAARDRTLDPRVDVQMAARCAAAAWGEHPGDPVAPEGAVGPVATVIRRAAAGEVDGAWALRQAVDEAAKAQWGPPRYHPLPMPGWAIPRRG